MIDIVVVEDQAMFMDSLTRLINCQEDMRVIGTTANADDSLGLCRKALPHVALLDVVTANAANGITAAEAIRRELPCIKVVLMTALPEITFIRLAKKAGIHGFVYKSSDSQELLRVLRGVMAGHVMYPESSDGAPFLAGFSEVEIAIIRLVCQGKGRSEIARMVKLSEAKVTAVIGGMLVKTGFDSIMKLSVYAVANGFILPDIASYGSVERSEASDVDPDAKQTGNRKESQNSLTPREEEFMRLVVRGKSNAEIARQSGVVLDTVKKTLVSAFRKLGAKNRVGAVRKYMHREHEF